MSQDVQMLWVEANEWPELSSVCMATIRTMIINFWFAFIQIRPSWVVTWTFVHPIVYLIKLCESVNKYLICFWVL